MIKEDYVSFETAKLLKEKGFDEGCSFVINVISKSVMPVPWPTTNSDIEDGEADLITLPTLQMAMKWLREEKHYYIQIMLDSWALGSHSGYYIVIQATDSDFREISPNVNDIDDVFFKTPEQAAEAAIKYCLVNLI